ncbi:MAG: flagellar filament capping protein FliD [Nitrospinae bacterium]|nr:flagellar filament capping protein FliD [Nitrospinota bacterium]
MIEKVSSYLSYQGHGMIERYPKDLNISYVASHEMRHAVNNELTALAKNENVKQDISYKLSISGGKLIAIQGVTEAEFKKDKNPSPSPAAISQINPDNFSKDKDEIKAYLEVTRLNRIKDNYENKIREIKRGAGINNETETISNSEGTNSEAVDLKPQIISDTSLRNEMERLRLKNEIKLIDDRIGDVKNSRVINGLAQGNSSGDKTHESGDTNVEKKNKKDFINIRGNNSETIANSLWFMRREVPGVILFDGAASAIKTMDTLKELENVSSNNSPIIDKINFGSSFLNLKGMNFDDLTSHLAELSNSSSSLSKTDSLNIHKGSSANSDSVDISVGFGSPDGEYQILVHQLASAQQIVSNESSDPFKSLGLSGSFTINGYLISVTSSDSLNDIKDKINFGEDTNKNGVLDLSEDLNKNGIIDSFFIKGVKSDGLYLNSISIFEDVNSNRQLDPSEDINNNERLDGGSSKINVISSIERNRLILTSTSYGDKKISLTDTDGILLSLGFFKLDGKGISLQKEQQLLSNGENLNKEPQKAIVSVNDIKYEKNTNSIIDIISDATINLKKSSSSGITVTISSDVTQALGNIKGFVDSFNKTLRFINDQIASDRMLNKDEKVQNIRNNIVHNANDEIISNDGTNHISQIGIEKNKSERRYINQLSLTNLLSNLKEQFASKGGNSIYSNLDEIGITSIENDTLNINEDRLRESLKNNSKDVYKILSGSGDSITYRIGKQMESALNPKTGTIRFRKDVIDYYTKNQNVVRNFLKAKEDISKTKIEGRIKSTAVSKVA